MKKSIYIFFTFFIIFTVLVPLVSATDNYIDSVPETEFTTNFTFTTFYGGSAGTSIVGQSLQNSTDSMNITSVKFYLKKINSPTCQLQAIIGGVTGTVGTNAYFNGTILASSNYYSSASLSSVDYNLIEFSFAHGCLINQNEPFGIFLFGCFGTLGSVHSIAIGINNTITTNYGNRFVFQDGNWVTNAKDIIFYLYGKVPTDESFIFNGNATIDKVFDGYSFYSSDSTLLIGNYVEPTPSPIPEDTTNEFSEGLIIGIIISISISLLLIAGLIWSKRK